MEAQLRHQQYILFYSGIAVLVFGMWSVTKLVIHMVIHPVDWAAEVEQTLLVRTHPHLINVMTNIFVISGFIISILVRLYLCRSAMKDAAGKKKMFIYLFVAAFLFLMNVNANIHFIKDLLEGTVDPSAYLLSEQTVTSTIIELTSNIALLLLVFSGVRVRILRKKLEKQKPEVNFGE